MTDTAPYFWRTPSRSRHRIDFGQAVLEFLHKPLSLVFRPKHLDTQPQHMTVANQIRAGGSLSQLAGR